MAAGAKEPAKAPRGRSWIVTKNNPTEDELTLWRTVVSEGDRFCWQIEKGEEGTPHIQGCVHFVEPARFTTLQNRLPGFHLEICRYVTVCHRGYGNTWT